MCQSCYLPFFFFQCYGDHRDLHSFPTRRSSDLALHPDLDGDRRAQRRHLRALGLRERASARSEEHTSELQSPYDLVCRLLLEKKKKKTQLRTSCSNMTTVPLSYSTHTANTQQQS